MERLKELLRQQHRDLDELTAEVQRKEITPQRIIRLMKMVQRNVEISERIVAILERSGLGSESRDEATRGFRTLLD